jgi:Right handed beta helix region
MSRYLQILAAITSIVVSSPSFAQATRTWVSGVGDDANPCSRTAPCKTFAGAISKTLAGGEINCLDPGGFGAVTITKSITLDCSGTFGSVLNSGTNGIIVNDSASGSPNSVDVILRGISIDGAGTTPGLNGIRFVSGRSLVLERVFVQNERGGTGISMQPAGSAEFYAEDVTVTNGAAGILLQPTGTAGVLRAIFRNVRVQNNSGTGLRLDTSSSTAAAGTIIQIDKSSFSGNADGIIVNSTAAGRDGIAMITDSDIFSNTNTGLTANGLTARVRVGNSTITINGTGVSITNSATMFTYGTNRLDGNLTNGAFTSPAIPEK